VFQTQTVMAKGGPEDTSQCFPSAAASEYQLPVFLDPPLPQPGFLDSKDPTSFFRQLCSTTRTSAVTGFPFFAIRQSRLPVSFDFKARPQL